MQCKCGGNATTTTKSFCAADRKKAVAFAFPVEIDHFPVEVMRSVCDGCGRNSVSLYYPEVEVKETESGDKQFKPLW